MIMMETAVQRFNCNGPVSPSEDCPFIEPAIIPAIIDDITSDKCCLIIGPPGSGTSTTLRAVGRGLEQRHSNAHWWLIDLAELPCGSPLELFHELALDGSKRFPRQRDSWIELTKMWETKESIERVFARAILRSIRDSEQQIFLAVDHIETAPRDIAKAVIRSVRALYTNWEWDKNPARQISVVMAGSHRLRRQGIQHGSPLNFAKKHYLDDLEHDESLALIAQVCNEYGPLISRNAAVYLARMTNGDRYLLQRLGQSCLEQVTAHKSRTRVTRRLAEKIVQDFIDFGYLHDPKLHKLIPELIRDEDALFIVRYFLDHPDQALDAYWLQEGETTAGIMRLFQVQGAHVYIRNTIYQRILEANDAVISAASQLHDLNNTKLERARKFQRLITQADLASESHEAMDELLAEIADFLEIDNGVTLMNYNAVAKTYFLEATHPANSSTHTIIPDPLGQIKQKLQWEQRVACLSIGQACNNCLHGIGANCNWLSLDLNEGRQHLGTLILRGSPWTLSFPKEKEFASLLTALASTLQARQRRRGLQTLSEVQIDQHSMHDVRGQLCLAIASLFNKPTIYLWDGSQKNKAIRLKASPAVEPADHLSLNVETILGKMADKGDNFIETNSFSNSMVTNDATAHLMEMLSLDSLTLSSFTFGDKRLGVIGIGSAEPWLTTRTEDALIRLAVERVRTTLNNMCFIYQTERRLASTKRAAYLLSHELKSDPARIVREIEIIRKSKSADTIEDVNEDLDRITDWALAHQSTVDRMLMFTWLDSQSWRPFMVEKPLIPVLQEILDQLKQENLGTRCFWFFEHDSSEHIHEVDSYSFYLIVRNLIQNALQYAPNSPIYINAWAESGSTCISVADKGPGVEPEHRDNLFEAFNRGKFNETRTGQQGNLGLGLYLVHELVKLHNGRVAYDTSYEDGARFLVTIPALVGQI